MRQVSRRAGAAAFAAAVLCGGVATAAPGDTVFTGTTDEGVKVKLTMAQAGNATKFKVGKTKVECEQGGTLTNKSGTYTDFDRSDPGRFSDKGSSTSNTGGYHFKTKTKLKGEVSDTGDGWIGSLKLTTKVFKSGDQVDLCKLNTAWTAT